MLWEEVIASRAVRARGSTSQVATISNGRERCKDVVKADQLYQLKVSLYTIANIWESGSKANGWRH